MTKIILKKGREESLLRFHPWVFSGAIDHCVGEIADGDVVDVFSAAGDFIAVGHFQKGTIAVRVLAFDNVAIDHDFWVAKLSAALVGATAIAAPAEKGRGDCRLSKQRHIPIGAWRG